MGDVLVGTCSWAEKSLIESREFYPSNIRTAEERLRYYAERFSTVEVDSTYYAIPLKNTVFLWSVRTPEGFIFHIKAYGALTGHGISPKTLPSDLKGELPKEALEKERLYLKARALIEELFRRFKDSLIPLKERGKLGLIVFQFPPWFRYSKKSL
ncbi:MAG: DUF72 domain-containing protein, partial [Nitrospirae bacterium]